MINAISKNIKFLKIVLFFSTIFLLCSCTNPQTKACQKLSEETVKKTKYTDYNNIEWSSFYSKKYDACIHTEKKIVGQSYSITDISHSIFKGIAHYLFICEPNQIVCAKLPVVFAHNGNVDDVSYSEWQDDCDGGPMDRKATKEECERKFEKWIAELSE